MLQQALAELTAAVKRNAEASQKDLDKIMLFLHNNNPNDDSVASGVIRTAVAELNKTSISMQLEATSIQTALDKATAAAESDAPPVPVGAEPKA